MLGKCHNLLGLFLDLRQPCRARFSARRPRPAWHFVHAWCDRHVCCDAVLFGSVTAAVRGMTTTESAETLTMYQMIFLTVFFALPLPFSFRVAKHQRRYRDDR